MDNLRRHVCKTSQLCLRRESQKTIKPVISTLNCCPKLTTEIHKQHIFSSVGLRVWRFSFTWLCQVFICLQLLKIEHIVQWELLVKQYDTCKKQPHHLGLFEFYYCTILNQKIKPILTLTPPKKGKVHTDVFNLLPCSDLPAIFTKTTLRSLNITWMRLRLPLHNYSSTSL